MATTAKVIIKAEDQISSGVKSATNSLEGMSGVASKLGNVLKGGLQIAAIAAGLKKLTEAATECVKSFSETQSVVTKLGSVLKATNNTIGLSVGELRGFADSLSDVTTFSDEAIMGVQQLLLTTQSVSKETLPQATEAALDMAAALGQDATSAAERLAQALADPAGEVESLREAMIYLDEEQVENIKTLQDQNKLFEAQQIILEEINDTYGGTARAIADMDTGKLTQIADVFQDIKSGLGEGIINAISPALDTIYQQLLDISDWINGANALEAATSYSPDLSGYSTESLRQARDQANENLDRWEDWWLTDPKYLDEQRRAIENLTTELIARGAEQEKEVGWWVDATTENTEAVEDAAGKVEESTDELTKAVDNIHIQGPEEQRMEGFGDFFLPMQQNIDTLETTISSLTSQFETISDSDLIDTDLKEVFEKPLEDVTDYIDEIKELLHSPELSPEQRDLLLQQLNTLQNQSSALNKVVENTSTNQSTAITTQQKAQAEAAALEADYRESVLSMVDGMGGIVEGGLSSLFDSMASSGGFTGILGGALNMAIGPILDTIQPLLDIIDSVANPLTIIQQILQGFVDTLAPVMQAVVQPLLDVFRLFGELLAGLIVPIFERLYPIIWQIAEILEAVLLPIFDILTPILELISMLLVALYPILDIVAVATITVGSVFGWLGDWIQHIVTTIWNWLRSINIFGWHPFGSGYTETHAPKDLFSYIGDNLAEYRDNSNAVKGSNLGDETGDTSTTTSITSATYTGSTSVTINIYQQAPVVGDGGMSQFARMLRREFEELDYYGVTT